MPLYPFCSHCCSCRVSDHVRTPVPPWPVDETGFTNIPQVAWDPNVGTVKSAEVDGWTRFTGSSSVESVGMYAGFLVEAGAVVTWHFTARSDHARDIQSLGWVGVEAVPDLTLYPEARRYRLRFVAGVTKALQIVSAKGLGAPEDFNVASDMQYKVEV